MRGALVALLIVAGATSTLAQIIAQPPSAPIAPAWDKGIQPISRDSYYNAIECGKKGGAMVAHDVWQAVRKRQEPPMPSYAEAQRTRITLGVTPVAGSKNSIAGVSITRGGKIVRPATQSLEAGGGTFIFDFPAFAATENITLELVGRGKTRTCAIDKSVLSLFR